MTINPDDLTPEQRDYFDNLGLEPENALVGGDGTNDPDLRDKPFASLDAALEYLTEEYPLLTFSRIYYSVDDLSYFVAIPDDTP